MVRGAGRARVVVGATEMGRREIGSSAGVTVVGAGAAASGAPTLASTGSGADAEAASGDAAVVVRPGARTAPPPLGGGGGGGGLMNSPAPHERWEEGQSARVRPKRPAGPLPLRCRRPAWPGRSSQALPARGAGRGATGRAPAGRRR